MRAFLVFSFTCLAIFWLLLSYSPFTLFAMDSERFLMAARCLFVLSLIAIWLPTGFFGRGRFVLCLTFAVMACWLAVTPWLYSSFSLDEIRYRLSAHVMGFVALGIAMITTYKREC